MNKISYTEILESLESLKLPDNPDSNLEQYFTPPKFALNFIKKVDVKNLTILDLASGPGVLGLCALLLGAKKVFMLDIDSKAITVSKKNYDFLKNKFNWIGDCEFINKDISLLKKSELLEIDVCLINPPFGTTDNNKKLDVIFLKKAMKLSNVVLTMHKTASKDFIKQVINDSNFKLFIEEDFLFPIYKIYNHHKSDVVKVLVTLFILKK